MYGSAKARPAYYEALIENITNASTDGHEFILLGDLNFDYKFDETLCNNPIYYLEQLFNLKQLITQPTRVTLSTATLLDVILTSMPEHHLTSGVTKIALSDHYMVFSVLNFKC